MSAGAGRRRAARILGGAVVAWVITGTAVAHDFWIQPADYRPGPGADTAVFLRVGHAGDAQRSRIPLRRIRRFVAIDPQGRSVDLRPQLDPGGRGDDGRFRLDEGAYQLVLESDAGALSHLPADRFNAHLEAEGLEPALAHRRRTGRTGDDGSERYGRVSKALVRVEPGVTREGSGTGWHPHPLGLPLEIVPEQVPDDRAFPAHVDVRVFEHDAPLAGALVKLARLDGDAGRAGAWRTDNDGRVRLPIPAAGHWLATVTWTRVLPPGSATDYETWFSSLSFQAGTGTARASDPSPDG